MLRGTLDPLRLRFASDELIYPMRLSRLAKTAQSLGLYVLAPHRMEPRSSIGGNEPEVTYAGKVERERGARRVHRRPGDLPDGPGPELPGAGADRRRPRAARGGRGHPVPAGGVRERAADGGRCAGVAADGRRGLAVLVGAAVWRRTARRRRPVLPPPPVHAPPPSPENARPPEIGWAYDPGAVERSRPLSSPTTSSPTTKP